jgi:hypothetical protein
VSANLEEGKQQFVEKWCELQGKKQFPYDSKLNESEEDPDYEYCRILKTLGQSQTIDQITAKHEFVIKNRYPVLDYLLKNTSKFSLLKAFNSVINVSNRLWRKANTHLSRGYCSSSDSDF